VNLSDTTPAEDRQLTATRAFDDADGVDAATIAFAWQIETDPGVWAAVSNGATFTPGDGEVGARLRVVATFHDRDGVTESVTSVPTEAVTNVNDGPSGAPVLSDATPARGQVLTALTGSIADPDGLVGVTFAYRWQQEIGGNFVNIANATGPNFTPGAAQVGRRLQVVVSFTDDHGTNESLTSAPSAAVTQTGTVPAGPPPVPAALQVPGIATLLPAPAAAPAASGAAPAPRAGASAAPALRIAALQVPARVAAGRTAPITVTAQVPAGARVVRIRVIRLGGASAAAARGRVVATVYRRTAKAGRHRFRLTERKLRRLAPGRYRIEVRAGRTRSQLGPARTAALTVKRG
jgi:hypothetical protein